MNYLSGCIYKLVSDIKNKLFSSWASQLDSLRASLTDTRIGYLDQIPNIVVGNTPAPKLRSRQNLLCPLSNSTYGQVKFGSQLDKPGVNVAGGNNTSITTTILNVTSAKGTLKRAAFGFACLCPATILVINFTVKAKIYIDGNLYNEFTYTKSSGWTASTTYYGSCVLVGDTIQNWTGSATSVFVIGTEDIGFNSSLRVDVTIDTTGTTSNFQSSNIGSHIDYQTF